MQAGWQAAKRYVSVCIKREDLVWTDIVFVRLLLLCARVRIPTYLLGKVLYLSIRYTA